ncbi:MAG: hypothetical protein KDK36_07470, partial [Leptospiraceae bacterium]|nr:hypothetical protein [Leptospiraceae bacterium]
VNQNGYSKVKMEKLGYINTDKEITFLKEPKIFKDAPSNNGFFHEGNSLQERIIPVVSIQSEKKKLISFNNSKYKIQADLTLGKVNHVLDLEIVTLGDSILFQSAIKLYLNMELENSVTVNIKQANVVKYFQNEIEVKPNEKYRIEFEILNESDTINSPKDSLKVWNPSKDSGVQEWISKIKIPIPGVNLSIASSKNITLPSEIEGDVKVILEMLLESGSGLITEAGINRKFGDPRKAARANRLFSKFLSERSNELNFSIIVESGSEGRIYKVGRR